MPRVFPPRYFIGWLKLDDGTPEGIMLKHDDIQFIPFSKNQALVLLGIPKSPFSGFLTVPKVPYPLSEIQYSINCLDGEKFLLETLNHEFVHRDTFLTSRGGLTYLVCNSRPLFKIVPAGDVFEDISRSVYPVTQFVS